MQLVQKRDAEHLGRKSGPVHVRAKCYAILMGFTVHSWILYLQLVSISPFSFIFTIIYSGGKNDCRFFCLFVCASLMEIIIVIFRNVKLKRNILRYFLHRTVSVLTLFKVRQKTNIVSYNTNIFHHG